MKQWKQEQQQQQQQQQRGNNKSPSPSSKSPNFLGELRYAKWEDQNPILPDYTTSSKEEGRGEGDDIEVDWLYKLANIISKGQSLGLLKDWKRWEEIELDEDDIRQYNLQQQMEEDTNTPSSSNDSSSQSSSSSDSQSQADNSQSSNSPLGILLDGEENLYPNQIKAKKRKSPNIRKSSGSTKNSPTSNNSQSPSILRDSGKRTPKKPRSSNAKKKRSTDDNNNTPKSK